MKQSAGVFLCNAGKQFCRGCSRLRLDNYRGEEYIREVYNPDCYIRLDDRQAIIYQQVQNVNGEAIQNMVFQQFQMSLV